MTKDDVIVVDVVEQSGIKVGIDGKDVGKVLSIIAVILKITNFLEDEALVEELNGTCEIGEGLFIFKAVFVVVDCKVLVV